jgi:hypothetical protein
MIASSTLRPNFMLRKAAFSPTKRGPLSITATTGAFSNSKLGVRGATGRHGDDGDAGSGFQGVYKLPDVNDFYTIVHSSGIFAGC